MKLRSDSPSPESDDKSSIKHKSSGLFAKLRAYFFTGILVTAPIALTFYIVWLLVTVIDSQVQKLIPDRYSPDQYLPVDIPGLGVVVVVTVLIVIGAMAAGFIGRLLIRASDLVMVRMPFVNSIYGAIKQIVEAVLANQSTAFREVVLMEYPRRGLWAVAFVTGRTSGEVQDLIEDEVVNVFLPTTPNPTSGFLLFVPRRDIVVLDMTVEEGIKMVVSGGIVTPPPLPEAERQPKPTFPVRAGRFAPVEIDEMDAMDQHSPQVEDDGSSGPQPGPRKSVSRSAES